MIRLSVLRYAIYYLLIFFSPFRISSCFLSLFFLSCILSQNCLSPIPHLSSLVLYHPVSLLSANQFHFHRNCPHEVITHMARPQSPNYSNCFDYSSASPNRSSCFLALSLMLSVSPTLFHLPFFSVPLLLGIPYSHMYLSPSCPVFCVLYSLHHAVPGYTVLSSRDHHSQLCCLYTFAVAVSG